MRYQSRLLAISFIIISASGCNSSEQPKSSYSCPDWSSNPAHNFYNKDFSNLGCAYYNNLAVQVSTPDDLQKGHGQEIGSGERESTVLQKYMSATQTTLTSPSTNSGSSR